MSKVNLDQIISASKIRDSKSIYRKNKELEKALIKLRKELDKPYQNIFRTFFKIYEIQRF